MVRGRRYDDIQTIVSICGICSIHSLVAAVEDAGSWSDRTDGFGASSDALFRQLQSVLHVGYLVARICSAKIRRAADSKAADAVKTIIKIFAWPIRCQRCADITHGKLTPGG